MSSMIALGTTPSRSPTRSTAIDRTCSADGCERSHAALLRTRRSHRSGRSSRRRKAQVLGDGRHLAEEHANVVRGQIASLSENLVILERKVAHFRRLEEVMAPRGPRSATGTVWPAMARCRMLKDRDGQSVAIVKVHHNPGGRAG